MNQSKLIIADESVCVCVLLFSQSPSVMSRALLSSFWLHVGLSTTTIIPPAVWHSN